jgi:hypothetical protein
MLLKSISTAVDLTTDGAWEFTRHMLGLHMAKRISFLLMTIVTPLALPYQLAQRTTNGLHLGKNLQINVWTK